MRILLFVLAIFAFVVGLGFLGVAGSAIHEIESFILFLISAVLMSGASVVEAINRLQRDVATFSEGTQTKNR